MELIPDMISKNEFLLDQLGHELSDEEVALQHELISSLMFRPHETELKTSRNIITAEVDTHSLSDFARQ